MPAWRASPFAMVVAPKGPILPAGAIASPGGSKRLSGWRMSLRWKDLPKIFNSGLGTYARPG
jgi:hypothetical protein